jgi:hypothetical protein
MATLDVSIPDAAKAICGQLCSIKYDFCKKAQQLKALLLECGALTDEDTYEFGSAFFYFISILIVYLFVGHLIRMLD